MSKPCSFSSALDEVLSTVTEALKKTQAKLDAETDDAKKLMYTKTIARANAALEKLNEMKNNATQSPAEIISVGGRTVYIVCTNVICNIISLIPGILQIILAVEEFKSCL